MGASWGQRAHGVLGALGAVAALLVFAPAAQAAFGFSSLDVTPSSTNAGANADVAIAIGIQEPSHDLRNLTIHLPPGLVGNPQAAPLCTETQLNANSCPAASQVGTVSNDVTLLIAGLLPVPQTVNGKLYNVVPRTGEPARFGIVLSALPLSLPPPFGGAVLPPIIAQSPASLRQSDLGLDTVLNDLPTQATILPGVTAAIDIDSVALTLKGQVGNPPKGFIRLPTSCGTKTVGFDADSWDGQHASGQATFETVNCGALPFTPELSAKVKQGAETDAVELTTVISQTIEEAGLKRAEVTLPKELFGNAAALGVSCPEANFQAGTCPANTVVGSAIATSPLLADPLAGPVALVAPATPGLPDLGIDLRGPLALKLKGKIGITADTRNVVTFDGLPDIPIADFALTFAGGPSGLTFANRNLCDPPPIVFDAAFDSHSGASATSSPTADVECKGGGKGGGRGHNGDKKPKAKIKVGHEGSERPTMKLKVKAGSKKVRSAKVKLPRQLGATHGKRFKRNVSVGGKLKLKASRHGLTLKSRKAAESLSAKLDRGALRAGKGLGPNSKLRFRVAVRDAGGKTTKLVVRAK